MNRYLIVWLLVCCVWLPGLVVASEPGRLQQVQVGGPLDVFLWQDVVNVYVLRDGEAAILIGLGDGSVLDHLAGIGIRQLEWVLLTHHHREQCLGHRKLEPWQAKIAVPERERALLERPTSFRKLRPALSDPFTVHGASYVRPPIEPVKIDHGFQRMDTFTWRGHEFWCLETAGASPGGMSYLLRTDGGWLAFSGSVMVAGARMRNWFDTEWDYGFAKGLYTLIESVSLLTSFEPAWLLPSHGPVIRDPLAELHQYQQKLRRLARLYVRGYAIGTFAGADQDKVSRPSAVPHLWQTTPHLFKFKGPSYSPNTIFLLADSGRALLIDCGLDAATLDRTLQQMQQRLGLTGVDAVLITHMHGDHVNGAPHARERWGAQIWTLDRVAEIIENPERFEYTATPWTYGPDVGPIHVDRRFTDGETFTWEGYQLTVDWMPGQTEFACAIHGEIDGRLVVFTGDNLFADPDDPDQDGHEALVARNSAILEEGYLYAAKYLRRLAPDLIMGGHSFVMDRPRKLIERYHRWALAVRDAYRDLSAEEDYRIMFDPYWVRADPYRVSIQAGGEAEVTLHVRNFLDRPQPYRIAIRTPPGLSAHPATFEGTTPPETTIQATIRVSAAPDASPGAKIIALDATLDNRRYGPWFDMIIGVSQPAQNESGVKPPHSTTQK
jgi:glyoxylase-like metal-dependent hydrolase (beta-lactamase superfamily II)